MSSQLVSRQEEAASESFASEGISGGSSASGISLDDESKSNKTGDRPVQVFLEFGDINTALYLRNVRLVENMTEGDPLSSKKQSQLNK